MGRDVEVARARELYDSKMTVHEVARELRCSYGKAYSLIKESGAELRLRGKSPRPPSRVAREPAQPIGTGNTWHRLSNVDLETRVATCSECGPITARVNKGGATCPTPRLASQRRARGVIATPEEIAAIEARAGGKCEKCGRGDDRLHLDHDHATGRLRGMLCHSCNTGIGMLGDDIAGLEAALEYLRRAAAVHV